MRRWRSARRWRTAWRIPSALSTATAGTPEALRLTSRTGARCWALARRAEVAPRRAHPVGFVDRARGDTGGTAVDQQDRGELLGLGELLVRHPGAAQHQPQIGRAPACTPAT